MKSSLSINKIEFKDVAFGYAGSVLFENVTFEIPQGQPLKISGAMGVGKSALLKVLVALLSPRHGEVIFNQDSIHEMTFEEFLTYRICVGYGFDLGGLLNNRTLRENLLLPLDYHKIFSPQENQDRVDKILEVFHLKKDMNLRPSAVSGSQRKALCVARSLIMEPQVLVLDDPTTGLSPASKIALKEWIQSEIISGSIRYFVFTSEDREWIKSLNPREIEIEPSGSRWVA